ncbi:ABC transporter substrate-binding protein [Roseomonas sp. E05]|uniref:ABC transporter substrate-binding protein n=1 Tax=Roseomonas sp. E05 TaxID=3046310 RepID=UPI0024BA2525|nr:ABC transporter substrate-binding protein [Roseomonas sp. E05]MDJ0388829.1 ABC transporter substrate-binding protein [Roseomonas sp. E05]
MKRRDLLLASLLPTMAAFAAPARAAPHRGGTLIFARAMDSLFLDPVHTAQNADIWISLNLYDTLLQPSADGKGLQPGLAAEHSVSEDGKILTFRLRPDLKFADGSPITVRDVKWSLDRARSKEEGGEFAFLLSAIGSIETQGEDTVIINMAQSDPAILQALATFNAGVVPEKLLMAAAGDTLLEKSKSFAEKPVGSGPFVVESWRRNSEMVLKRNPYYWKEADDGQKLPYLDAIRFVIIPDDATRILKLKAGEVDVTEFVPYARVAELRNTPGITMTLFPAAQVHYFTMNNRPTLKDGTKNPLADQRVRQALNYATNKEALIQVVTHGVAKPARSYMPIATPMAYDGGPLYPYDLAKAKALLAEAGYPNGGFEVTCMALAGNADDAAKLQTLQQMWSQVGVKLKIEQLESATRLARFNATDFQMRTSLWTNDLNDPKQITSIFAYYPARQSNRTGWNDPRVNELFEQSEHEMDSEKRTAMYKEIQQRYYEAAPIIFGMDVPYPIAMSSKVHDFVQIPLGNNIFINAYKDA